MTAIGVSDGPPSLKSENARLSSWIYVDIRGRDLVSRIAAPMMGGMITAPLLSMFVIPAAYLLLRRPRRAQSAVEPALPVRKQYLPECP